MPKKSKGWVIIDRTLCDNPIWKNTEPFDRRSAWIDLILMVNHEDGEFMTRTGENIKITRGSTFTSIRHLADRWHWSNGKVCRFLEYLSGTRSVTLTGTQTGTLISLVKYEDFQGQRNTNGYTDRNTDGIRTKNERKNERKKSTAPASLEERFAAIERNAKKKEGDIF